MQYYFVFKKQDNGKVEPVGLTLGLNEADAAQALNVEGDFVSVGPLDVYAPFHLKEIMNDVPFTAANVPIETL